MNPDTSPPPLLAGLRTTLLAAVAIMPTMATATPSSAPESGQRQCFFRRDWKGGWKTAGDAKSIYIAAAGQVYRLDFDLPHPLLKSAWALLSDKSSTSAVCAPQDLNLVVSDRLGFSDTVIVRRMVRLSPQETQALPADLRPPLR